jgi:DNA invertase Pin-like site-specific DNA recombinase
MTSVPHICRIGYACVRTPNQNLEAQFDALTQAGCGKLFFDCKRGRKTERPGWDQLMAYARSGDTVVVTDLSRMAHSVTHLLDIVKTLDVQGIELVSLREHLDTTTETGRCFRAMVGVLVQTEGELRVERTAPGRAAAKARGRTGGRPRTDPAKLEQARLLYLQSDQTAAEVCQAVGIGRRTLFSYLAQVKAQEYARS